MYLWLRCEGWARFGPFASLRFDAGTPADPPAIRGPGDVVVAHFDGHAWRTPGDRRAGYAWETPTVTSSPRPPHG